MLQLTKADRDWFIKYIIASTDSREDWYKNNEISRIIFSVGIREGSIEPNIRHSDTSTKAGRRKPRHQQYEANQ